ncbi:MAG TPA: TetR/AcrR family transcriptional regulator [Terrimesophilobacter sp.]|uniref:TetR/AcrR family transcriptional regulator n=1 Tax=Terrimesophilobacter sp. TaxID=2906435 RepID=UPI002F92A626
MNTALTRTVRSSYRHGDLHQALIDAALAMAAEGGPDAVVLREATRRAGVSPNAAYRHFSDRRELLQAVSAAAQGLVADAMEQSVVASGTGSSASAARAGLRAVGSAYIGFAREHPGLFRVAFGVPDDLKNSGSPAKAGEAGRTPFQILGAALDRLVSAGVLPTERRKNAEFLAWSAVHGLGMLVIDGPLRGLNDSMISEATERLLDMVERGL